MPFEDYALLTLIIAYPLGIYFIWVYVRLKLQALEDRLLPKKTPLIIRKENPPKQKQVWVRCVNCGKKSSGDLRECPYCKSIVLRNA